MMHVSDRALHPGHINRLRAGLIQEPTFLEYILKINTKKLLLKLSTIFEIPS